MEDKDLKILKKVSNTFADYKWGYLSQNSLIHSSINFPEEADNPGNSYYAEIIPGLIIVSGFYSFRFYHDEDKYTLDKKYFASIISNQNAKISNIAFISNEDYENKTRKDSLFKSNYFSKIDSFSNPIIDLYDSVNRTVNEVDNLYDNFLNEDS